MANLLQSSQTQATTAPSYYTNYLSNLATAGQTAQQNAQYVGAQPLQTQAFSNALSGAGSATPLFSQAGTLAGQSGTAASGIQGAGQPYLQAGTSVNPLCRMQPYVNQASTSGGIGASSPYINQATQLSGTGVANPYLSSAAAKGGLCFASGYLSRGACTNILGAANPYLAQAASNNPAQMAAQYMNPYIKTAVQCLSDVAQRNIQQNLAPEATAAAVGAGQFGSQRGAQVLGQIEAQAQKCLNSQIAQMEAQGYGQALCAAGRQQALLGQLGSTAGSLTAQQAQNALTAGNTAGTLAQQQQNLLGSLGSTAGTLTNQQQQNLINAGNTQGTLQQQQAALLGTLGQNVAGAQQAFNTQQLQAAQTAGCLAAKQSAALGQAGAGLANVGTAGTNARLACLNALATLGAQQQTIGQNQQLFPLTTLGSLAGLLQGYNVPTSVSTTLCQSPLSSAAAVGSTLAGLTQSTANNGPSLLKQGYNAAKSFIVCCLGLKDGGAVPSVPNSGYGCCSLQHRGALPTKRG